MLATGLIIAGYVGTVAPNISVLGTQRHAGGRARDGSRACHRAYRPRVRSVEAPHSGHRLTALSIATVYDYRKALVDFGRGLSSATNLRGPAGLDCRARCHVRLLWWPAWRSSLWRISGAVYGSPLRTAYRLKSDLHPAGGSNESLDLEFLNFDHAQDHSHIFLENAQASLHLPPDQQRTAALLDLNYYLPCRVAASTAQDGTAAPRTIAVIGAAAVPSAATSSLLKMWSCWNRSPATSALRCRMHACTHAPGREDRRVRTTEREFNENIVESINVGILAIDLEDRIESWNAQMEVDVRLQPCRSSRPGTSFCLSRRLRRYAHWQLPQRAGRASSLQIPPHHPRRRAAHRQHCCCSTARSRFQLCGPHHSCR